MIDYGGLYVVACAESRVIVVVAPEVVVEDASWGLLSNILAVDACFPPFPEAFAETMEQ